MPVKKATVATAEPDQFRQALTRLASDPAYREQASAEPSIITKDFRLGLRELQALRQVAIMSGADVTAVNRLRAEAISKGANQSPMAQSDINISCCSCCCCCCGETAVVTLVG